MKFIRLAMFLVLWLAAQACLSAEGQETERKIVLVTARAVSAEFVRSNSSSVTMIAPMTYKVRLNDVLVVHGGLRDVPPRLTVELFAHHKDALLHYKQIFLVLDITDKSPKVLYWENVLSVACVPVELIDERYKEDYFDIVWDSPEPGTKCVFVRGHRDPPEPAN